MDTKRFFSSGHFFEGEKSEKGKKPGLAGSLNLSELFPPSSKAEVNSRVF
jgi:hypothetical protein